MHKSSEIGHSFDSLRAWISDEDYHGWDPFDALSGPIVAKLAPFRLSGIFWVQLLKWSPLNLRSTFGIPKTKNPKAFGLFLASHVRRFRDTGSQEEVKYIVRFAKWLLENTNPLERGLGWSYPFDWPNRSFFAPAGTPNIVTTSFVGLSLLDLLDLIDNSELAIEVDELSGTRILQTLEKVADLFLFDLNRIEPSPDELCFSYTSLDHRWVHNANLLGTRFLARFSTYAEAPELLEVARKAANFSARRQLPDGSWRYGTAPSDAWIDNFHTGYVLVALKEINGLLGSNEYGENVESGYALWKRTFFGDDGCPYYYLDRKYPIDIHNVAQGILTFLAFSDYDPEAQDWAEQVALWGIENMQSPDGYFYYQKLPLYTNRIPYMRWSQAWMLRALSELLYFQNKKKQ